jgi:hypothetical protein
MRSEVGTKEGYSSRNNADCISAHMLRCRLGMAVIAWEMLVNYLAFE